MINGKKNRAGDGILGFPGCCMNRINTVIFDMDGTVLDTLDDLADAVNHVLGKYGMPARAREKYRQFFGNGIRYAMRRAAPADCPDDVIDGMLPAFRTYYNEHCLDRTRPYSGIPGLMKELKRRGYKMAIVSNKIDSAVKELNDRFFSDYVSIAIGERPGIRRKPAADTVLAALAELGASGDEAVYVGDSEVDLQTARNAGLPCITVLWGFRDRDFLEENGAAVFAQTPEEIISILENRSMAFADDE